MEEREETIDSLLVITTPRLLLRETSQEDIPTLFQWRNDKRFRELCSSRRDYIEYEDFVREINNDLSDSRLMQMIIYRKDNPELPIGTIYAYDYNPIDRNVSITIFLEKKFENLGIGVESIYAFSKYLFETFNLYKVYIEIYEYNKLSINTARRLKLSEEGRLLKHRLFNQQRWDILILAIYPTDLEKAYNFLRYWNNRKTKRAETTEKN